MLENITVVIPVRNEELNLAKCLAGIVDFPNVVVVDSGSKDKTRQICRDWGVDVINFDWNGSFPKKRNWFLENHQIETEWVFFLDADEVVTSLFAQELDEKLRDEDIDGFMVSYSNIFLGSRLRYGIPQRKLAIFKKNYRFEKIELQGTSEFDMEIHEHPVGIPRLAQLKNRIEHYDYKGLSQFIHKHRIYAEWECERYFSVLDSEALTFRQRWKYRLLGRWYFAGLYFFVDYVFFGRFLDGRAGLAYSRYKMWYFGLVRDLVSEQIMSEVDSQDGSSF